MARKITADDVKAAAEVTLKPGRDYYQAVADKLNEMVDPPRMIGRITLEGYGKSNPGGAAKIKVEGIPCWTDQDYRNPQAMAEAVMGDYGIVELSAVQFTSGLYL